MILERVRSEVEEAVRLAESSPYPEGALALGGVYASGS
jgi:TPP-dependent pyruvate/acetoin dehydrogenase alpha subunit